MEPPAVTLVRVLGRHSKPHRVPIVHQHSLFAMHDGKPSLAVDRRGLLGPGHDGKCAQDEGSHVRVGVVIAHSD